LIGAGGCDLHELIPLMLKEVGPIALFFYPFAGKEGVAEEAGQE
jgi:hypothetical protein